MSERRSGVEKQRIILVTCGAFNPIHIGHLEMCKVAKRRMEQDGAFIVEAILFSPSHDEYVVDKMILDESVAFTGKERAAMIDLAIANDEELKDVARVERLEIDARRFINHTRVVELIQQRYDNAKVVFVAGSDLACRMLGWEPDFPVVVVKRKEEEGGEQGKEEKEEEKGEKEERGKKRAQRSDCIYRAVSSVSNKSIVFREDCARFRFVADHDKDASFSTASSSRVRAGSVELLPASVVPLYIQSLKLH